MFGHEMSGSRDARVFYLDMAFLQIAAEMISDELTKPVSRARWLLMNTSRKS
jgi:hypothetical protein